MGFGFYGGNLNGGGSSELPPFPPSFPVDRPANPPIYSGEPLSLLEADTFNSHEYYLPPRMNMGTTPPPPYVPSYFHMSYFNGSSSGLNHVPLYCNGTLWDRQLMPIQYGEDSSLPSSSVHVGNCNHGNLVCQKPSFIPVNFMNAPVASSSVLPKTHLSVPPMDLVNGKMNQSIFFDEPSAITTEKSSSTSKEAAGISFAHVGPDAAKKALDSLDSVIAGEKISESSDHQDSNVKLPCCKGGLTSDDSQLQSSVPVSVQLGKQPEIDDDSNCKMRKVFPMKFSDVVKLPPRKLGEIKMTSQNGPVSILSSGDRKTISGKQQISGSYTSLLIDSMHKLSKFLLNHCSDGTCVLSEQDGKSLEQVIFNLDKCLSANIGQELYSDLRKHINIGCLQVDAIDAPSRKPEENRKQSDEKDEKISSSVSVKSGSDTGAKMDKKAQDVALFLASPPNMRIEMEKSLSDDETEDEKSSSSDEKLTALSDSGSDPSVTYHDSVSTVGSDEDLSSELDEADHLATEANGSSILGQSPQDMLANDAENQSDIKDFHLCSQHDCTTGITSDGDGFSASWDDDSSSDWEHVSMEELLGLNSSSNHLLIETSAESCF